MIEFSNATGLSGKEHSHGSESSIIRAQSAGTTQRFSIQAFLLSTVVDAFAARDANHARTRPTRHIQLVVVNCHALDVEQLIVRCFAIGAKLPFASLFYLWITSIGE